MTEGTAQWLVLTESRREGQLSSMLTEKIIRWKEIPVTSTPGRGHENLVGAAVVHLAGRAPLDLA
jgi:hypothetical protein